MELGAVDYIHKPFISEIIKKRVDNHIEIKAEKNLAASQIDWWRNENDLLLRVNHMQKLESIGRLTSGIAHDFNNTMTAIIGYSSLVLSKLEVNNPIYKDIEEIKKQVNQEEMDYFLMRR